MCPMKHEDLAFDPDASDDFDIIDANVLSSFCLPPFAGDTASPTSKYLCLLEIEPDGVGRLDDLIGALPLSILLVSTNSIKDASS